MTPETAASFLATTAAASGLTFPPEALEGAAQRLVDTVERDTSGSFSYLPDAGAAAFRIVGGAVVEIPVGDFLAGVILQAAKPIAPVSAAPAVATAGSPPPVPTRPKPGAAVSEIGKAFEAMHDAAMIAECETWPNPWKAGQVNRTRQTIIINKHPTLAARLKAQAGT